MSAYVFGDPRIFAIQQMCVLYLRPVTAWVDNGAGLQQASFTPALSAGEQTSFADIETMAHFGVTASLTLAEFQALKPDLATAKAFLGIASPTAAQSNAAIKSTIRVLGALLRS